MEMINIDDVQALKQADPSNMLDAVYGLPEQMEQALSIAESMQLNVDKNYIKNIIVTGLGGSAIGGDLVRVFAAGRLNIPMAVNRDYVLPSYVGEDTLVFASSYSGNTEETLSAYDTAKAKGAQIIAITTGGQLLKKAQTDGYSVINIPAGLQPRAAIGVSFVPLVMALAKIGLLDENDVKPQILEAIELLKIMRNELNPSKPEADNLSKQLAKKFYNNLPVIYGVVGTSEVVAQRWKGQICENAKAPAHYNIFPEWNHNELVGTEVPADLLKRFQVIMLRDKNDHPRIQKRIDITKEILKQVEGGVVEIWSRGNSDIARIFSLIYIGDYASVYLALLNGVDPSTVEKIDLLKNKLAKM
jgi:glucose/mannose-6-phosphate isomerase